MSEEPIMNDGQNILSGLRVNDLPHQLNSTILPQGVSALPSGTAHKTGNAGSSPASPSRSVR
jgi:hypothetical protein